MELQAKIGQFLRSFPAVALQDPAESNNHESSNPNDIMELDEMQAMNEMDEADEDDDMDPSEDGDGMAESPNETSNGLVPSTPITEQSLSTTTKSRRNRKFPSDLKTLQCPHPGCNKTFNRPARLSGHLRSHKNDRVFKCQHDGCDKTYLESKHLKQHIKSCHDQQRDYRCDECGKSFLTATRLRRHGNVHKGQDLHRCRGYDGCNKSFRKRNTLSRHIRTEHLGLKAYTCNNGSCTAEFDSTGALRRHIEREHGDLKYWCDICGRDDDDDANAGTESAENYGDDGGVYPLPPDAAATAGTGVSAFGAYPFAASPSVASAAPTPVAFPDTATTASPATALPATALPVATTPAGRRKVGFTTQALLNAHFRLEHCNCMFCDLNFASPYELQHHMDIHHSGKTIADRKTIACTHQGCDKMFTKRSNLNVHVRTAHEGLRFVCRLADLSASTSPELAYWDVANGCDAAFSSKAKMEEHIKHVHMGVERKPATVPASATSAANRETISQPDLVNALSGVGVGGASRSEMYVGVGGGLDGGLYDGVDDAEDWGHFLAREEASFEPVPLPQIPGDDELPAPAYCPFEHCHPLFSDLGAVQGHVDCDHPPIRH